jgi:GGDEF domain-containing protein
MVKSRIGWSADRWRKTKDRRSRPAAKAIAIRTEDLDPVLGTLPLRRFLAILDDEVSSKGAGALLVLDLDGKARSTADLVARNRQEILPLLAQAIRQAVRSGDLIAHLDACRFVILLRGAPQAVADKVARRILDSVDDTVFLVAEGLIRLSVGVGGVAFGSGTMDRRQMLERAAENLERMAELDVRAVVQ